jgi:hypothetical protein
MSKVTVSSGEEKWLEVAQNVEKHLEYEQQAAQLRRYDKVMTRHILACASPQSGGR